MKKLQRRTLVAAGATLASGLVTRKPWAATGAIVPGSGRALPPILFRLPDGTEKGLVDFLGQGVVLNFWATWCVPCVAEMPSLDALAGRIAGQKLAILPLSSDRGGAPTVTRFFEQRKISHLPILLDPAGAAARMLNIEGIPTTILVDAHGMERGRVVGTVDWDSPEALKMIKTLAPG